MKAIDTRYGGQLFRSRLEARWATFFDTFGIKWEYEKEGYDLDGLWYLPDFWLPELEYWIEIKPFEPNAEELEKAERLTNSVFPLKPTDIGDPIVDCRPVFIMVGDFSASIPRGWGTMKHRISEARSTDYIWSHCSYCGKKDLVSLSVLMPMCGCHLSLVQALKATKESGIQPWYEEAFFKIYRDIISSSVMESKLLASAYLAAMQARFEHGANGN